MQNRLLGIHMIVQNEEQYLPRCLDSLKHAGTEWFITDTGSSDRTAEIARTYGATVLHARWEEDFAQARNISLPLANTDWILVLDADEYVTQGLEELLNDLPKVHKSISSMRITIENLVGEAAEEKVISHPVRLFRAHQGYRYTGRIHEQLVRSSPRKANRDADTDTDIIIMEPHSCEEDLHAETEPLAPLCLVHDGYLASTIAEGNKPRRNLKMIERELADDPAQPFHLYNLGVTYCQLGQLEPAMDAFHESLRRTDVLAPYRPTLVRDYAKVLVGAEQYNAAYVLLAVERQRYPSYADLHLLYGVTLEQQGLEERAYQAYARASDCQKELGNTGHTEYSTSTPGAPYVTEAGSDGYRAYTPMARLAQKRGFFQEAVHLYGLALDSLFTYGPAWTGLADVLQQSGETDKKIAQILLSRARGIEGLDLSECSGHSGHGNGRHGSDRSDYSTADDPNVMTTDEHLTHMVYVLAGCGAYEQALNLLDTDARRARIHAADRMYWMLCAGKVSDALQLAENDWADVCVEQHTNLPLEHRINWGLACWGNELRLSDSFLVAMPPQEKDVWKVMDRLLNKLSNQLGPREPASEEQQLLQWSPQAQMVTEKIVEQAVKTGQLTLAEQLHELRAMIMRDHRGAPRRFGVSLQVCCIVTGTPWQPPIS
ncbi:glycosyltransferase family 2 protein [Paenibacillus sp. PCH8]|uniref:glycosyltransferase family 2 protein n=1 Tax=Paenibacillus sp. PCH8 TaxID=2066524 RepID=UPI0015E41620|nr:glycosyltransferase family 2 protein [Paenibacillus sp. PCH8]